MTGQTFSCFGFLQIHCNKRGKQRKFFGIYCLEKKDSAVGLFCNNRFEETPNKKLSYLSKLSKPYLSKENPTNFMLCSDFCPDPITHLRTPQIVEGHLCTSSYARQVNIIVSCFLWHFTTSIDGFSSLGRNRSYNAQQRMIDWSLVTVIISSTSARVEGQLLHKQGLTLLSFFMCENSESHYPL